MERRLAAILAADVVGYVDELTEDAAGPEIPAPLGEPAERLFSYAKTLVLERGIQLENAGPDGWRYHAKGSKPTATLSDAMCLA